MSEIHMEVVDRPLSLLERFSKLLYYDDHKCDYCGDYRPNEDDIELTVESRASVSIGRFKPSFPVAHYYRLCSEDCLGSTLRTLTDKEEVEWSAQ